MSTIKKSTILTLLLGLSLILAACGTINVGVENTETIMIVTESEPGGVSAEATDSVAPVVTPEVPTLAPTSEITQEATGEEASPYWAEVADPRTGVRFALPCFWEYEIPQDESGSLAAFSLRNYPYSYAESFPRGVGVFEAGGIKFDVLYFNYIDWGLPGGSGPRALVESMYSAENSETTLNLIEQVVYNDQAVLRVVTESTFGIGISYWYDYSAETALVFGLAPTEADGLRDVQAILSSVALSPEAAVQMPHFSPDLPPAGVDAPCLAGMETPSDPGTLTGTLDCATTDTASLDYAVCNVIDGLRSGNLSALISWMGDPFIMGYWGSEHESRPPAEVIEDLRQNRLPAGTSQLSFTNDRSEFPPLSGILPENMPGPENNIVEVLYSEGWGKDGLGSALLFFAQEGSGGYRWVQLLLSYEHFDK